MKTVYFIRHGQSQGNASLVRQQTSETELTARGLHQAREMAQHLKTLPIEAIISSTFARAKATAGELGKETGIAVEYSDLFVERRRPGVQLRKPKAHPHWLWVQVQLALFDRRSSYRHSDEETAEDLLQRAHRALAYLANRPEPVLAVVTHKTFMRALHAAMTFGEGVTGKAYLGATRRMDMRNTALMVAEYEEFAWSVKNWNEDATEVSVFDIKPQ